MKTWDDVKNRFYYWAIKVHKTNPNIEVDELVSEAWIKEKGNYDNPYLSKNIRRSMIRYAIQNKSKSIDIQDNFLPAKNCSLEIKDMAVEKIKRMILSNDSKVYSVIKEMGVTTEFISRLFGLHPVTIRKYLKTIK